MGRDTWLLRLALGRSADQPPDWTLAQSRFEPIIEDLYRAVDPNSSACGSQIYNSAGRPVSQHIRNLDGELCDAQNAVLEITFPADRERELAAATEEVDVFGDGDGDEDEEGVMALAERHVTEQAALERKTLRARLRRQWTLYAMSGLWKWADCSIAAVRLRILVWRSALDEPLPFQLWRESRRVLGWAGLLDVFTSPKWRGSTTLWSDPGLNWQLLYSYFTTGKREWSSLLPTLRDITRLLLSVPLIAISEFLQAGLLPTYPLTTTIHSLSHFLLNTSPQHLLQTYTALLTSGLAIATYHTYTNHLAHALATHLSRTTIRYLPRLWPPSRPTVRTDADGTTALLTGTIVDPDSIFHNTYFHRACRTASHACAIMAVQTLETPLRAILLRTLILDYGFKTLVPAAPYFMRSPLDVWPVYADISSLSSTVGLRAAWNFARPLGVCVVLQGLAMLLWGVGDTALCISGYRHAEPGHSRRGSIPDGIMPDAGDEILIENEREHERRDPDEDEERAERVISDAEAEYESEQER